MMRTNSRGSVTSGGAEEPPSAKDGPSITSQPDVGVSDAGPESATIEPPELFPAESKGDGAEVH